MKLPRLGGEQVNSNLNEHMPCAARHPSQPGLQANRRPLIRCAGRLDEAVRVARRSGSAARATRPEPGRVWRDAGFLAGDRRRARTLTLVARGDEAARNRDSELLDHPRGRCRRRRFDDDRAIQAERDSWHSVLVQRAPSSQHCFRRHASRHQARSRRRWLRETRHTTGGTEVRGDRDPSKRVAAKSFEPERLSDEWYGIGTPPRKTGECLRKLPTLARRPSFLRTEGRTVANPRFCPENAA